MSLVAYGGSSDEEEEENEDQEDGGGKVVLVARSENGKASNGVSPDSVTFSKLPQPIATETVEEVQDEFLKKKEQPTEKPNKQPIRISVPSVAQFDDSDDEDDGAKKKAPKVVKESGLFALLPPPKGTPLSNKSFVPHVLTKKPQVPVKEKKKVQPKPVRVAQTEGIGESDDEDLEGIPETFDEETWKKVCAPTKKPQKRTIAETQSVDEGSSTTIEIAPEAPKPYDGLDNEAFKQLVGSSKRRRENIKLIDINEEEVTLEKDIWITKSLTDPEMAPKEKEDEEEPVNNTCRRKHHITYLAQQAKANEQELQTQWSHNKYKKQQTRSKYGF